MNTVLIESINSRAISNNVINRKKNEKVPHNYTH